MAKKKENNEKQEQKQEQEAQVSSGYTVSGVSDLIEYGRQIEYIYKTEGANLTLVDAAQKAALKSHFQYSDHKLGNQLTNIAKKMAIELATKDAIDPRTNKQMTIWELDEFLSQHNTSTKELEAFWYTLQIEAEHLFDSFLLFVERKRQYKQKFYLPRRKIFWKFGISQSLQDLEDDKLNLLALSLPPGTGKALKNNAKVVTPSGFTTISKLKVGEMVISGSGKKSTVLGVYPQGKKPIYRLKLDDGSTVEASSDHLWTCQTSDDRKNKKYRTIKTSDMLKNFKTEDGKRCNYSIDYVPRFDFEQENDWLPLHPYKIGTLLGKENENLEKHIPDCYLYSTYENRLELLRGLLDKEGCIETEGIEYTTLSQKLANNVRDLVHSLGGYCSMAIREVGDGVLYEYNTVFKLTIQFSAKQPSPFGVSEKREAYKPKSECLKRFITDIEYVGEDDCTCIYIDDDSHLFITDDYILTHNTTLEKYFASWVIGRHILDYSLFYSHSDDITRMFYDGVVDITTNETEYQYNECWLAKPVRLYGLNAKRQTINFTNFKPFASIQCTSVGAKNAGKVRCNRYLYCDDLIGGIEEALNKNQLDKLWEKYSVDARQRMLDDCKEIHIATRWSVHDVIGRLQNIHEGDEKARFINIPALDEGGHSNFKYRYHGFKTKFFREQQEIMDELSFNALYMGQPIEREGLLYHPDEMRYYTELPDREPDAIIGICDTKSKGTDYMFAPCLYQYDSDYYCVDCVCDDTTNYSKQYAKIADLICENGMKQIEFESNAGGDRVAFEVDKMVKARGYSCNVTTKPTETNKETRIITYSDWIKKNIIFKSQEQYTRKSDYGQMMYWLFAYTQTGKNVHDDVPDGFANFAKFVERKYNVRPTLIINSPF